MINEKYACAYKEVIEVLKYTRKDDVNKIPKHKIMLWKKFMKKDYNFKIDKSKTLEQQGLSKEAKAIIANIFKKYMASEQEKEIINKKEKQEVDHMESLKADFNPEMVFNNTNITNLEKNLSCNQLEMVANQEPFFKKIFVKIKGLFKSYKK